MSKTQLLMALALRGDGNKGGEVPARLRNGVGWRSVDCFKAMKDGARSGYTGDLNELVRGARDIAKYVEGS